jgi:hypothetical protein
LAVGVHGVDVFGLVEQINIADFEVHALFEQNKTAALRERARGARIQNHHCLGFLEQIQKAGGTRLLCIFAFRRADFNSVAKTRLSTCAADERALT